VTFRNAIFLGTEEKVSEKLPVLLWTLVQPSYAASHVRASFHGHRIFRRVAAELLTAAISLTHQ
jgi:hypothetical protein